MVAVLGPTAVSDAEWNDFVSTLAAGVAAHLPSRALVVTLGAAPSPAQRVRLEAALGPVKAKVKAAIISDGTFTRGVVNALALFTPGYHAFSPDRLDEAIAYLDVRFDDAEEIRATVARLLARMYPATP